MWTVLNIEEIDDDFEIEVPIGLDLTDFAMVTLECDDGRRCMFECAKNYIKCQEIELGDEWPEDIDEENPEANRINRMAEWMESYYEAIEELPTK